MNLAVVAVGGGGRQGILHKHQSRTYDEKNKAPCARGSHILVKMADNEQVSNIQRLMEENSYATRNNKAKRWGQRGAGAEGRPVRR